MMGGKKKLCGEWIFTVFYSCKQFFTNVFSTQKHGGVCTLFFLLAHQIMFSWLSWQANPIKVTKPRVNNSVQANINYNRINGGAKERKKRNYMHKCEQRGVQNNRTRCCRKPFVIAFLQRARHLGPDNSSGGMCDVESAIIQLALGWWWL